MRGRPMITSKCVVCGVWCVTTRAAYRHCQQRGKQRQGFHWRLYVPKLERFRRRMSEIKKDAATMEEIEAFADYCLAQIKQAY
jgi:hypothetical protein